MYIFRELVDSLAKKEHVSSIRKSDMFSVAVICLSFHNFCADLGRPPDDP